MRFLLSLLLPALALADVTGIVVDNTGKRISKAPLWYSTGTGGMHFSADSNGTWRIPFASGITLGHAGRDLGSNGHIRIQDESGRLRILLQDRKADGSRSSPIESNFGLISTPAPRVEAIAGESLFVDMYGGRNDHHSGIAIDSHDTTGVVLTLNLDLHVCQNLDATDSLLDCRDGQKYPLVEIAKRKWTSRNLAYAPTDRYGVECPEALQNPSPNTYPACGATLGLLYDQNRILSAEGAPRMICPDGSHVARGGEWDSLVAALGGSKVADSVLRSEKYLRNRAKTWDTFVVANYRNESGFGALNSPFEYSPSWVAHGVYEWELSVGWLIGPQSDYVFEIDDYFADQSFKEGAIAAVRCVLGK